MKIQFLIKQYLDMSRVREDQPDFARQSDLNLDRLDILDFNIYLHEQAKRLGFIAESKSKNFLNYFARAELKVLSAGKSPDYPHLTRVRARFLNRSDFEYKDEWLCDTVLSQKEKIAEKLKTNNFKIHGIKLDQDTNTINILVKIIK